MIWAGFLTFCFLLGGTFVAIKIGVRYASPEFITVLRICLAAVVLVVLMLASKPEYPKKAANWIRLGLAAVCSSVFPYYLIGYAETDIDGGMASILMGMTPIMAVVGAHIYTRDDSITWRKVIGVFIGFLGLLSIFLNGLSFHIVPSMHHGAAILAAACYVTGSILIRSLTEKIRPITIAGLTVAMAALVTAPFIGFQLPEDASLQSLEFWGAMLYLGIVGTAITQLIRIELIQKAGVAFVGYSGYLVPVFGVLLSNLILSETVSLNHVIGLVLILVGGAVANQMIRL
jgi:drug/metabolite transporter (DMT)-like permease